MGRRTAAAARVRYYWSRQSISVPAHRWDALEQRCGAWASLLVPYRTLAHYIDQIYKFNGADLLLQA